VCCTAVTPPRGDLTQVQVEDFRRRCVFDDRPGGDTQHSLADVLNMGGFLPACALVQESA